MPKQRNNARPLKGIKRLLFRAPLWFYRLGLGNLLGRRFILLNHTGRKSGAARQAVLEVVDFDPPTNTYFVASGFGKASDWYQNIVHNPQVRVQVGRQSWAAVANPLPPEESGTMMADYARRHPAAAKQLMRLCGFEVDGTDADYRAVGREHIPFVALQPKS
jgi:deazaflavin-dependent oxidoreductase (nitroreductase family)